MKRILFLCTGNSARSQMAEGLTQNLRGDEFEVCSAGTDPKEVHPLAIKVMKEIGMDISAQKSKLVDEYEKEAFDYIVTLCDHAATTCPSFPGEGENIHQRFPDPSTIEGTEEEKVDAFRNVRDELKQFVLSFPSN